MKIPAFKTTYMKTLFFLALAFFILSTMQAQTYVPIPVSDVSWNEFDIHQDAWGCYYPDSCNYTLIINGILTVNSLEYNKVYRQRDSLYQYRGAFREENKRVYFIKAGCSNEILLYDFTLTAGDTMFLASQLCAPSNNYMVVSSIDSIQLLDNTYRKRINFAGYCSWVEGIGSLCGFLYPKYSGMACICGISTVCFQHNNVFLYIDEIHMPCFDYLISANEILANSEEINIYPNPVSQSASLLLTTASMSISSIEIFNALGINKISITGISGNEYQLETNQLSKGLYFIRVNAGMNSYIRRVLVY
jgi:hypothetical protein